jgi:amidohydrolase family protein
VIVRGSHIERVASANVAPPAGARIVDGSGRFLIPGLWDMHVHLSEATAASLPLLIANGVTGVRDMGSDIHDIRSWRDAIEAQRLVGPHIVTAGPKLDGEGVPSAATRIVRTPDEARDAVNDLAAAGADLIKVHGGLDRGRFLAIAEASRAHRLPFAGHLPTDVTPREAARAGIQTIEHFSGFPRPCSDDLKRLLVSARWTAARTICAIDAELDATFAALRDAATAITPTLVSYRGLAEIIDPHGYADSRWRYVPAALRNSWNTSAAAILADVKPLKNDAPVWRRLLATYSPLTVQAQRHHVTLLAGTDLGNPLVSPGFDLHDELLLMINAGLTPAEALRSATAAPAALLRKPDRSGRIVKGDIADLVLLDANPLLDIRNVQRIGAVIANGQLFDRRALDDLLAAANPQDH